MSRSRITQLVTELASNAGHAPLAEAIVQAVVAVVREAYDTRDVVFPRPGCTTLGKPRSLPQEVAVVGDIDLKQVLTYGAQSSEELDALCAVLLLGVASNWPNARDGQQQIARQFLWLEAFSGLRCLSAAVIVFDGRRQNELAGAIFSVISEPNSVAGSEYAIGRAWLSNCSAPECSDWVARARSLSVTTSSNILEKEPSKSVLRGVLAPKPRSLFSTAILSLTTILFVMRLFRAIGHLSLNYKRPASLSISPRGLELESRFELLGRVIKEQTFVVPLSEVRQIVREVRYPRLGVYAGLAALTLGTLVGARLFVDGLRVSGVSFTMMAWGAAFVLLGLVLDLVLTGLSDGVRGRCRIVVRTQKNGCFAVGAVNPSEADRLLFDLQAQLKQN
jgi:hypothetical protein